MSPPRHISHSLLLPTTGLQVNTSSKPPGSYHYYRSPCHHLTLYLILHYYLTHVYRSTRRQNPQKHTSTTGHHVTTSPYILFSTPTYYRSTGQHVVKTSEAYQYYRSPCHHLAIYLIFYSYLLQVYRSTRRQNPQKHTSTTGHHVITSPYPILYSHLLQVYRSTRRQNPQNHTSTTGHHVTTSPYILFSTPTYYRSTGQHVFKTLRSIPVLQVTMSLPQHLCYSLLLPTTVLQVNASSKLSEPYQHYRSPCPHRELSLILC